MGRLLYVPSYEWVCIHTAIPAGFSGDGAYFGDVWESRIIRQSYSITRRFSRDTGTSDVIEKPSAL